MARTLYDVLMISPLADRSFMTMAYRHLAKRYHPDVALSREAAARMAEINEAYAILGDPSTRAAYDQTIGLRPGLAIPSTKDEAVDRSAGPPQPAQAAHGEAGPPPANPAPVGPELTFGRYHGWTLNQVARFDRDYLEWLSRTTMGRNYRRELDALLRRG
jgi:curved DNA-binding protein CbpA